MINNIKELIKNKEQDVLGKLDQDLINTFKSKINNLNTENIRLNDEVNSITRNFEALCLKSKEDSNLIKKLESKIKALESKYEDKTQFEIISGYKSKIDQLNGIVKDLEAKLNSNSSISSKNQEKENFYRNFITKLEDKVKGLSLQTESLSKENNKLKSDIKVSESKKDDISNKEMKKGEELQTEIEKMRKEIEISSKLLCEYRERSKNSEEVNDGLTKQVEEYMKNLAFCNTEADRMSREFRKQIEEVCNKLYQVTDERDKFIKQLRIKEDELSKFMDENSMEKAYERFNIEIDKLTDKINCLTNEIEVLTNKNNSLVKDIEQLVDLNNTEVAKYIDSIESLSDDIKVLKDDKNILLKKINSKETHLKDTIVGIGSKNNEKIDNLTSEINKLNSDLNSLVFAKALAENKIKEQDTYIKSFENEIQISTKKFTTLENKNYKNLSIQRASIEDMLNKFSQSFTQLLVNNIFPINDKISALKDRVHKLNNIIFAKTTEIKDKRIIFSNSLQNKLEAVKSFKDEKNELLTRVYKLKQEADEGNKVAKESKEGFTKYKEGLSKFLQQVVNSNLKLKLSIETLFLLTKCKGCSNESNRSFILQCGHSSCENCANNGKCIECNNNTKSLIENLSVNNLFTRIKFINQLVNDIDNINNSIKEYV
jgi:chromosome segregation ATPase